jgi:hypothetical protein
MADSRSAANKGYVWTLLVPLFGLGQWLLEKSVDKKGWFEPVPWWLLLTIWAAVTFGVLAGDLSHHTSVLRQWWRTLRGCFVVTDAVPAHRSTPEGREWLEITVHLRFTRRVTGARLAVRVFANTNLPAQANQTFVLTSERLRHAEKDHARRLIVAVIPLSESPGVAVGYSSWGDRYRASGDVDGMHSFHVDTDNIVAIEVDTRWRYRQRELVFVAGLNPRTGAHGRVFVARAGAPANLTITQPAATKA